MFQITISAETAEEFVGKVTDLAAQFEVEAKPAPAPRAARKPRNKAAEEVAEKDQAPETEVTTPEPGQPAPAETAEQVDVETLRKWVISDYLNKHLSTPQDRAEAFKAICVKFGLAKFGDMTDEQAPQVKAHVQQLIDAAQASK